MGVEEFLRAAEDLDRPAGLLDELTKGVAHGDVVIDNENGRRTRADGFGCQQRRCPMWACQMRAVEHRPDEARQILSRNRFAAVDIALPDDVTKSLGRNVSC